MTTILFDADAFTKLFPEFVDSQQLQLFWDTATAYINNQYYGCTINGMSLKQQTLALQYMTAHLAWLAKQALAGGNPGFVESATIDKITVAIQAPPSPNSWKWWLNQSPYGQALLALLSVSSVGGMYYGGYPTVPAFRR